MVASGTAQVSDRATPSNDKMMRTAGSTVQQPSSHAQMSKSTTGSEGFNRAALEQVHSGNGFNYIMSKNSGSQ